MTTPVDPRVRIVSSPGRAVVHATDLGGVDSPQAGRASPCDRSPSATSAPASRTPVCIARGHPGPGGAPCDPDRRGFRPALLRGDSGERLRGHDPAHEPGAPTRSRRQDEGRHIARPAVARYRPASDARRRGTARGAGRGEPTDHPELATSACPWAPTLADVFEVRGPYRQGRSAAGHAHDRLRQDGPRGLPDTSAARSSCAGPSSAFPERGGRHR